jgi:hypothetical protein
MKILISKLVSTLCSFSLILATSLPAQVSAQGTQQGQQGTQQGQQATQQGKPTTQPETDSLMDKVDNAFQKANHICPVNEGYNADSTKALFENLQSTVNTFTKNEQQSCGTFNTQIDNFQKTLSDYLTKKKSGGNDGQQPPPAGGQPPPPGGGADSQLSTKNQNKLQFATEMADSLKTLLSNMTKNPECSTKGLTQSLITSAIKYSSSLASASAGPLASVSFALASKLSDGIVGLFSKLFSNKEADPIGDFAKDKEAADVACIYSFLSKKRMGCNKLAKDELLEINYDELVSQCEQSYRATMFPQEFTKLLNSITSSKPSSKIPDLEDLSSFEKELVANNDSLTSLKSNHKMVKGRINKNEELIGKMENKSSPLNNIKKEILKQAKSSLKKDKKILASYDKIIDLSADVDAGYDILRKLALNAQSNGNEKEKLEKGLESMSAMLNSPLSYYNDLKISDIILTSIENIKELENNKDIHFGGGLGSANDDHLRLLKNAEVLEKFINTNDKKVLPVDVKESLMSFKDSDLKILLSFYKIPDFKSEELKINDRKQDSIEARENVMKLLNTQGNQYNAVESYNRSKIALKTISGIWKESFDQRAEMLKAQAQDPMIDKAFEKLHQEYVGYGGQDDFGGNQGDKLLSFVNGKIKSLQNLKIGDKPTAEALNKARDGVSELVQFCHSMKPMIYTISTYSHDNNAKDYPSMSELAGSSSRRSPGFKALSSFCGQFSCHPKDDFPDSANLSELKKMTCSAGSTGKEKADSFLQAIPRMNEGNEKTKGAIANIFDTNVCENPKTVKRRNKDGDYDKVKINSFKDLVNNLSPMKSASGYSSNKK